MRSKRSVSWLFLLATCFRLDLSDAAPINLNLKSGLLSRWMGKSSSPKNKAEESRDPSSSTATASTERSKGKRLLLDLSGIYHCLVVGPENNAEGAPTPLYKTGTAKEGWSPPSLTFSVGYNFSQAWYGATGLLTNLQWSYRKNNDNLERTRSPLTVNIQGEKGLMEPDDYAVQIGVSLKAMDWNSPSLQFRWEANCKQVSVAAPLHKRVSVVWRSVFPTRQHESHFASRSFPSFKDDWWIPNLKVNTAGRLTADNEVGFRVNNKRRVGVQLLLSRQLGWSAFGTGVMDDHLGTVMKLQVTGTDDRRESFTTFTMESMLERPQDSTQLTFSHEQVHKN